MDKPAVLKRFISKNILIDDDALSCINLTDCDIDSLISACITSNSFFVDKDQVLKLISSQKNKELPKTKEIQDKNKEPISQSSLIKTNKIISKDYSPSVIINSPIEKMDETHVKNTGCFSDYFTDRYEKIKNILLNRPNLRSSRSLNNISSTSHERNISVIIMINSITTSKNGHTILEVEDNTSQTTAIIMKDKNIGQNMLICDEVVGLVGSLSNGTLFVNEIIYPSIPSTFRKNYTMDPVRAVFISDTHIGSNEYIEQIEKRFLTWINGKTTTASEVKYLCIAGDLVDGVGIYPSQEKDLKIKDIFAQYAAFESFIEKIPEHIQIIICPGNHDAVRQAEPQPPFDSHYFPNISSFKNIHFVSNPSSVTLHALDENPGISVLMYHGYSFTSLTSAIPDIRKYGISNPKQIIKEVIRKRHLAPLYGSTILNPRRSDNLVISKIPDILHTGDLHSFAIESFDNKIDLFSTSTFQGQTSFMDRVGHIANPGKVIHENLMTRQVTYEKFY